MSAAEVTSRGEGSTDMGRKAVACLLGCREDREQQRLGRDKSHILCDNTVFLVQLPK